MSTYVKTLSRNDVGSTGGHQAGIVVPRSSELIEFFPSLDVGQFNPRCEVFLYDAERRREWEFNFVYYNGALLNLSTRNEYRLTGLTAFFRTHNAEARDELVFSRNSSGVREIAIKKASGRSEQVADEGHVVVLSGSWKTIRRGNFL